MKKGAFWLGVFGGIVLSGLVGFLVLPYLGIFDTTATGKPNILDWWGETNLENYVSRQAPGSTIPTNAEIEHGFEHYRSMCLHCHGAPEASGEEWASHMLPAPPELWDEDVQHMSDGELFFIVSNGIRMTGMPAFGPIHSEEDIWNMVAFVRQLTQLTQEQKTELRHAAEKFEEDEEGESGDHGHDGE